MSSLIGAKLRRDLRASWSRFVLMTVAIAVSLTVFAAILFAWNATGRETSRAYMSTEPASATIVLARPIDADRMAEIAAEVRTWPQVIEAAGRTQFETDVARGDTVVDNPMQVFVATPDDPMRIASFDSRRPGQWPPAGDEIYLGADSLSLFGLTEGEPVTITPPRGDPVELRVAGSVYDPSLAPSPSYQRGFGYLSTASLGSDAIGMDQLKIQVADHNAAEPTRERDTVVTVATDIAQWLEHELGLPVREAQVPEPYAHPHQWQFDALLGSLLAGGAAALLLSTILVATMLNNLFIRQIPQIGIMKAIGARSGRIGRLYLAMTLIVSVAATLLALGPALLLGRLGADRLPGMLGIEPVSLAPAWWTYVVVVTLGVGLPVLIALVPLVKVSRTTVRAAIDHHGLSANPSGATGWLARLSRIRRLDRGLLLALRNTVRRPARFVLSVGLLAVAGTVFVAGMSMGSGVQAVEDQQIANRSWDVDVQLADPVPVGEVMALMNGVPGVASTVGLNVAKTGVAGPGEVPVSQTYPDQGHGSVRLTAIRPGEATMPDPDLIAGRWLEPGETGTVVLSRTTAADSDVMLGDTVRLMVRGRPTTWRIVGIAGEGERGAYTTAEGLAAALGEPITVNQLRVVTDRHDEATRDSVADSIDATLSDSDIEVVSAASISRANAASAGHTGPIVVILLAIAIPLGVIGAIGLAATMSASVLDRIREFGVMHAIGAQPKIVRRIVIAEGVFLALASCVVAILPALGLTKLLGIGFGNLFMSAPLPFRVSLFAVGAWFVLAVFGAILATDAAAARASRITVREALAYV